MNLLSVEKLTMAFGGITAVSELDLNVQEASIHAVIGPNGAGKTTLFNIVSGIYKPTCGNVKMRGRNIQGLRPDKICSLGIARTFQNIRLFQHLTVLENAMIGRHCRTKAGLAMTFFRIPFRKPEEEIQILRFSEELLDFVGLSDRKEEKAGNLPYGSQRRLEIVRALASDPSVLLLDEPCAGMGGRETDQISDLIKEIRHRGITVVLIEHDMKFVMRISDVVSVLNFGRKIAEGRPQEVQTSPAVIEAYLGAKEDPTSSAEHQRTDSRV